jgi:CBS domain-containing protein
MALTVRDIMDADPVTVGPQDDVETVVRLLRRYESRLKKAFASKVADLMTEDPVTIESGASVPEAGRIIARRGHNRLPVTEHGRLVGVVTRVDVLEALTRDQE